LATLWDQESPLASAGKAAKETEEQSQGQPLVALLRTLLEKSQIYGGHQKELKEHQV